LLAHQSGLLCCGVQGGNDVQIMVDKKWKLPDGVTCERCVLQVNSFQGEALS
jgi:hypothetical protein